MMRAFAAAALLLIAGCATPRPAATTVAAVPVVPNPTVGGAVLPPGATIGANLAAAPILATLGRAVAAAGEAPALVGAGPVTLFAPTEEAFGRFAPGTIDALLQPENRATLVKLVTLHMVAGRWTAAALVGRIADGGGRATLTTVAGEPLMLTLTGSVVTLTDAGGDKSYVEIADVRGSNGVIHVVNGVLVPRVP